MKLFGKLLAVCVCLIVLLCCVPAALAAGQSEVCAHCGQSVTWKSWDGSTVPAAGHYALNGAVTVSAQKSLPEGRGEVVIDLKGNTMQLAAGKNRMFLIYSGSKLTFLDSVGGGTVISNQTTAGHSGIVQLLGGELDIYGGTFKLSEGSAAQRGGLFYAYSGAKVNVYGGTFHGVPVSAYGGIFAITDATLNVTGGTFYPGSMLSDGQGGDSIYVNSGSAKVSIGGDAVIYGGVDLVSAGSFTVSGKPVIQKAEGGSAYSLRVADSKKITVGKLEEGAKIAITGGGVVTNDLESPSAAANAAKYFAADEAGKAIKAKVNALAVATVSTNTSFDCPHCDEVVTWEVYTGKAAPSAGHYYLNQDTQLTASELFDTAEAATMVLNLNGYTLLKSQPGRMFQLDGKAQMVIMDTSVEHIGAMVTNNDASQGDGMAVLVKGKDAALTVYDGTFCCGTVNNGAANGGLLSASAGKITIHGGEFWGTQTQNGGVVAATSGAALEITGGTFYAGTATAGDTIYASGKETNLTIAGTAVIKGGVYVDQIAAFHMAGAPQIQKASGGSAYSLWTETKMTLGAFEAGAKILMTTVPGQTVFTVEHASAEIVRAAQKYFISEDNDKIITVEGTALTHIVSAPAPADSKDQEQLNAKYVGTTAYHGEMHDHSASGGKADGKVTLDVWKTQMEELKIDFATLVDHKQASHMRHELWDNTIFVGGTEASSELKDLVAEQTKMHFNMIFSQPEKLEEVLYQFYNYNGVEFSYKNFTQAQMRALVEATKASGGMFVHVHPKSSSYIKSDNPLDYWYGNDTGLEVYYSYKGYTMNTSNNVKNYKLWTDLLDLGKRVWATAGHDGHKNPSVESLTTIYAEEKNADCFVEHMRVGDFTAGAIGIRMSIDNVKGGAQTVFEEGDRLVLAIGDFHESLDKTHSYRVDIVSDRGHIYRQLISATEMNWLAFDVDPTVKFYRAEIYDVTLQRQIVFGQPIWNSTYQEDVPEEEPVDPSQPVSKKCPHCDKTVEWTVWDGTTVPKAGHYILAEDVVNVNSQRSLTAGGDVVIDLNGKTLQKVDQKNRMFRVDNGNKLVFLDSSARKTGTVIGYQGTGGHAGIIQLKGGDLDIYGGIFKMCDGGAAQIGGLIYGYKDTNTPTINIYGGTFYGTLAKSGGVLSISGVKLNISGGTFYPGSVWETDGVGGDTIYVAGTSSIVNISGNPVIYGGIEVSAVKTFTVSGAPVIQKADGGSAYSIKLAAGKLLTVGALEEGASIAISAADGVFTAELADESAAISAAKYFTTDDVTKAVATSGKALAVSAKPEGEKCPHCNLFVEWKGWDGTTTPKAGHYILESAIVEVNNTKSLSSGDIVIDLNGNTLQLGDDNKMFLVKDEAKLVFLDSSEAKTGTVISNQNENGHAGIAQLQGGSMDIYGGIFKMSEGSVAMRGGLFYVYKNTNTPKVNIYDGTFYGIPALGGGVIFASGVELNIQGGTFYAGSTREGGLGGDTIYVDGVTATVNISGDAVIYGGIQVERMVSFTISGKPVIQKAEGGSAYGIKLSAGKVLTVGALEEGASIGITAADGAFTAQFADESAAAAAAAYFTADEDAKEVVVSGNTLAIAEKAAEPEVVRGDLNGDGTVSDDDAMYLLRYTLFGDSRYPMNQGGDVNGDGAVSDADAMYLLRYTLFGPSRYPLH